MRGKLDWSSIHLFKNAHRTEAADEFPLTAAALEAVDLVRIDGTPMEAFFSRLIPGAYSAALRPSPIRLTVHLPLIVPEDCGIRVGDVTHHWIEGKIVAFDDSFDHEAWNNAPTIAWC
ncbi:MAG: aspartyl/asparaginyl beta-hydroxylase domain-containing protein [Parvularculaceae bacterium]